MHLGEGNALRACARCGTNHTRFVTAPPIFATIRGRSPMKKILFYLSLALVSTTAPGAESVAPTPEAGPARLLRHPTYAKGKIAFSHLGDIWIASENGTDLRRLTDHTARDIYPRFSPGGNSIAFSSNRNGNYDVFVVAATGGKPRQLTFHSADDTVVGWTPDGRKVMFASVRNRGAFPSVSTLFEISATGGMEQSIPTDWGTAASYAPDGLKLAFTRHPAVWSRQHYRGSYAADLWVMDVATKKYTALGDADFKGNYLWPMYGRNGDIYFVSDRLPNEKSLKFGGPEVMKSVNNIWKISERGGAPVQLTRHTSGNLFFPSISADAKTIVYEENFGLWKLDLASGRSTEIRLQIASDSKSNDVELRVITSEAVAFSLSPSSKRAAIATHGEIFTIATDRGAVQRVTETAWREESPRWSPDGKRIAFLSDRTGREEIWLADERGLNLKQLSDIDCDKSGVTWAPDSKSFLWSGSDHKLRRTRIADGQTDVVASSEIGAVGTPQFSPDGNWISYTKPDTLMRSHVHVKRLEGDEERMIEAEDFLISTGAKWTPDGKKLLLLGGSGTGSIASLSRTTTQLYSLALTRIEKNPDDRDVDTEEQTQAPPIPVRRVRGAGETPGTAAPTDPAEGGAESARRPASPTGPKIEVKIEWDGLNRRIKQITRVTGSVVTVAPSPDSRTYAFFATNAEEGESGGARSALYTVSEDGTRLTRLSQAPVANPAEQAPRGRGTGGGGLAEPQWSKDGRAVFYLQSGGIYSVAAPGAPAGDSGAAAAIAAFAGRGGRGGGGSTIAAPTSSGPTPRRVSFTVRLEVDRIAERRQVFNEAWRVMKHRFYDPAMHGVDWSAAKAKYEPLLANVADSDELYGVINQMIGELNASHTGVSAGAGRGESTERIQTRFPGFELEPDASGYYKISAIHRKGPADHEYLKLHVGDHVVAVNGKALTTADNYWKFFNLVPSRKFEFTVNSKPETTGAWTVSLEPLSATAQGDLDYRRWVDLRKTMVEKLSGGTIGYLHIKAMDSPSFQKFQRDLQEHLDKKALIIDQRFNGGGGIDQELLEVLGQRIKYQSTRGRDSAQVPRPIRAFYGPMAVLQNERSASDAEMFPDGFRALGLGKIIGVPTMGAVIGTGSHRLLDGATIRTPGSGVVNAKGQNMENYGVPPDVLVDNTPGDFLAGHDRQVEKAVEVLRAELK
ncbi:MAG: biopolymer transporter Tol [Opitutus sp.]|nr:biopolymer transporter Tol [Opitutus sp.]